MIAPLSLLGFALAGSLAARVLLTRTTWLQRSPTRGIWVWQALSLAIASALLLAGLALALPALPVRSEVASVFSTTPFRVAEHYTTPAGVALAVVASILTAALFLRVIVLIAAELRRSSGRRSSQIATLELIGVPHPDGFTALEHEIPLVYCLPGRRRTVVVTSAALRLLGPRELELVLAHELTHLRARHDLALAVSSALARAFSGVPVFGAAHAQISTLVEMQADDSARARSDRRLLAGALVRLSTGSCPPSALAAGDTAALERVQRLTRTPVGPLSHGQSALVGLTTALVLSAPLVLALAPAIEATIDNCWTVTGRG